MQPLQDDSYIVLLILSAGLSIFLAFYTLRQRKIAGATMVAGILLLSGWFALTYAFELVSVSEVSRLFWLKLEYITIVSLPALLLIFFLRFTGHSRLLKRPLYLALLIEPLIVLTAVWTTPLHTAYYQSYRLDIVGGALSWQVVYGPIFLVHSIYNTALSGFSLALVLAKLPRATWPERRQIFLIVLVVGLTGLGALLYSTHTSPGGYDHTPLFCICGGMLISQLVLKARILEMSPMASESVLQSMGDGVILVDRRGVVTRINPAAERMTGLSAAGVVAAALADVLPDLAARLAGRSMDDDSDLEMELGPQQDRRVVAVRFSPVQEERGQMQGWLLLMRDITEARRVHQSLVAREAELHQMRNFSEKIIATAPLGIAIYNTQSQALEFSNPGFSRIVPRQASSTHYTLEEIAGWLYPEDAERRQEQLQEWAALNDDQIHILEYHRKIGPESFWTRLYYAVFERDPAGKISKILVISSDITAYKHTLENLAQSEARFRSMFEGIPIGLYRVTHDGWLLEANQALAEILGFPDRTSLMAHNVTEFYVNPADRAHMLGSLAENQPLRNFEFQLQRYDGTIIWASNSPRVIHETQDRKIYEGSIEDITHRKNVEAQLQNSEERLRNMFNLSPNSMMLIDVAGKILDCNLGTLHLHEEALKENVVGQNIFGMVSLEDHNQFLELLRSTIEEGGQRAHEMTLLRKDGQRFRAELYASPIPNPAGSQKMVIVTASDISPRKEAEDRLHDTRQQLAQRVHDLELHTHQITLLTEMSNMLQICLNPREAYGFVGHYGALLFPQMAGQMLVISADRKQLSFETGWGISTEIKNAHYLPEDCWALRSGQAYLARGDNRTHLCQHFQPGPAFGSLCVPILSEGRLIGVISIWAISDEAAIGEVQVGVASAMAEQVGLALSNLQLRENLRELAIHDPLTGLYNRYYLRDAFENALLAAQQNGQQVSLIMMDLDYFKALNTRYGHVNADAVLVKFGALMSGFMAKGEVAFRFGGDEFVWILPNANLEQAVERANAFRQRVGRLVVQPGKQLVIKNLTVSVGISGWPEHGHTLDDLLQAADMAMFRAKEQRDQVRIAD